MTRKNFTLNYPENKNSIEPFKTRHPMTLFDNPEPAQPELSYYDSANNLQLPRPAEYYYNWQSLEFGETTLNVKLTELGFLISKGFDLRRSIAEFKNKSGKYNAVTLSQTLVYFIMYIRYRHYYKSISKILLTASEFQLTKILNDELLVTYNATMHDLNCFLWTETQVLEFAAKIENNQSDAEKFVTVVCSSDMALQSSNQ